jgi:UDP-N-acetylbacillosamine N-acetyltransferase
MSVPLVIWGASAHAAVVADIVRQCGEYEIRGFVDDIDPSRRGTSFCGNRVLGGRDELAPLKASGVAHVLVALGDCDARLRLAEIARAHGFALARAIHPRAVVAPGAEIGGGTVVCAGAVLCTGVRLGENVIVNTSAGVDHDSVLEDGVHLSPGARTGGRVVVGRAASIGMSATLVSGVRIGERSVVGAGAIVLEDIPPGVVAWGVPARIVRERDDG